MSIVKISSIFAGIYVAALVIMGTIFSFLNLDLNISINAPILVVITIQMGVLFAKKNQRYFTAKEQLIVIVTFIMIDAIIQYSLISIVQLASSSIDFSATVISQSMLIVTALHAAVIILGIALVAKHRSKQYIS